jgi:hypothetical protein
MIAQSKPSANETAETTHPPLSALDLAHLAASLDPALFNMNPEAALLNAYGGYQLASLFVERNAHRNFVEIYNDTNAELASAPLMEIAMEKILAIRGEADKEEAETAKLRFYPSKSSDAVRTLLNVTTEREIKNPLERWFVARAEKFDRSAREGRLEFKEFWRDTLRKDEEGEKFYAIGGDLLEGVIKHEASRNTNRSKKAAQSRRDKNAKRKQLN